MSILGSINNLPRQVLYGTEYVMLDDVRRVVVDSTLKLVAALNSLPPVDSVEELLAAIRAIELPVTETPVTEETPITEEVSTTEATDERPAVAGRRSAKAAKQTVDESTE